MEHDDRPPPPPSSPAPFASGGQLHPATPLVGAMTRAAGGFTRAIGLISGLFLAGGIFLTGLIIGVVVMIAGSTKPVIVEAAYRDGGRDTIAIIPVEGFIDRRKAEFVRAAVDHVLDRSSVRAVILRVDSPGGGVTSSDQIWKQIQRLSDAGLPVIASYGGIAASGGYYISCGTDQIVAEPTCITGSIGVILQTFIIEDLLGRVGIEPVTLVSTGSPNKDLGSPFRSWTEKDRDRYIAMLDAAYDTFSQRVKAGRKDVITEPAAVDALADGSIYTAQTALENGLIDAIGYLDDAIGTAEKAARLATGRSTVVILRRPPTLFGNGILSQARAGPTGGELLDAGAIRRLVNDLGSPRLMYLMK